MSDSYQDEHILSRKNFRKHCHSGVEPTKDFRCIFRVDNINHLYRPS